MRFDTPLDRDFLAIVQAVAMDTHGPVTGCGLHFETRVVYAADAAKAGEHTHFPIARNVKMHETEPGHVSNTKHGRELTRRRRACIEGQEEMWNRVQHCSFNFTSFIL